ncbi:MAG: YARHG domain-containing protein [Cohaesibacteraceae bacterium]
MADEKRPKNFADALSELIESRGIASDEQLARRAAASKTARARRLDIKTRTINNWRNGRTAPRSATDAQFIAVTEGLKLTQEEVAKLCGHLHHHKIRLKAASRATDAALPILNTTAESQSRAPSEEDPMQIEVSRAKDAEALPEVAATQTAHEMAVRRWPALQFVATIVLAGLGLVVAASIWATRQPAVPFYAAFPEGMVTLSTGGFVLPDSDERRFTAADVAGLTSWELYVARNEIFARKGWIFREPSSVCLREHFNQYRADLGGGGWYIPRETPSELSNIERHNATVIRREECLERGGLLTCAGQLNQCS